MKTQIKIGDKRIGEPHKCFVVAEAGSNHDGKLELAKLLIDSAKECGCDAVKFQAFKTENLVTKKAQKAEYQKGKGKGRTQFEMLKDIELSQENHQVIVKHAKMVGIPIFYSVFDQESATLIDQLGTEIFKIGSGELTNIPLIKYIAQKGKPVIISTGMGTDEEINDAVNAFQKEGNEQLLLMNCSTGYPSRFEDANLRRVKYLEKKYDVLCGHSDHTEGILVSVAAAVLDIPFIEKHFTLDKNLPGPDHSMSIDTGEMKKLCAIIRIIEKNPDVEDELLEVLKTVGIETTQEKIEMILGREDRVISEIEQSQRFWTRKSLVATRNIKKGEFLTDENTALKRPAEGILPKEAHFAYGKKTLFDLDNGAPIKWEMING